MCTLPPVIHRAQPESYPSHRLQAFLQRGYPRPSPLPYTVTRIPKARIPATSINCHPSKAKSYMPQRLCGRPSSMKGRNQQMSSQIRALRRQSLCWLLMRSWGQMLDPRPGTPCTGFFGSYARVSAIRRIPGTGSSLAWGGRCSAPDTPCTCSLRRSCLHMLDPTHSLHSLLRRLPV